MLGFCFQTSPCRFSNGYPWCIGVMWVWVIHFSITHMSVMIGIKLNHFVIYFLEFGPLKPKPFKSNWFGPHLCFIFCGLLRDKQISRSIKSWALTKHYLDVDLFYFDENTRTTTYVLNRDCKGYKIQRKAFHCSNYSTENQAASKISQVKLWTTKWLFWGKTTMWLKCQA